LVGSA